MIDRCAIFPVFTGPQSNVASRQLTSASALTQRRSMYQSAGQHQPEQQLLSPEHICLISAVVSDLGYLSPADLSFA